MSVDEFAEEFAKELGVSKHRAKIITMKFIRTLTRCVLSGAKVKLSGLMTIFYDVVEPTPYTTNLPGKEKRHVVPKRMKLFIKPSKTLKTKVREKKVF